MLHNLGFTKTCHQSLSKRKYGYRMHLQRISLYTKHNFAFEILILTMNIDTYRFSINFISRIRKF